MTPTEGLFLRFLPDRDFPPVRRTRALESLASRFVAAVGVLTSVDKLPSLPLPIRGRSLVMSPPELSTTGVRGVGVPSVSCRRSHAGCTPPLPGVAELLGWFGGVAGGVAG